jgi:hypothetical protein
MFTSKNFENWLTFGHFRVFLAGIISSQFYLDRAQTRYLYFVDKLRFALAGKLISCASNNIVCLGGSVATSSGSVLSVYKLSSHMLLDPLL